MEKKEKKPRRESNERKAIRAIMVELSVNYTTALREYEKRKKEEKDL